MQMMRDMTDPFTFIFWIQIQTLVVDEYDHRHDVVVPVMIIIYTLLTPYGDACLFTQLEFVQGSIETFFSIIII